MARRTVQVATALQTRPYGTPGGEYSDRRLAAGRVQDEAQRLRVGIQLRVAARSPNAAKKETRTTAGLGGGEDGAGSYARQIPFREPNRRAP